MPYDEQTVYADYLESTSSGCNECKDCDCCPPGLVSLKDQAGEHLGCVTPNDAQEFKTNNIECPQGYIALYNEAASKFLGCVSEGEFATLYAAVNQGS